MLSKGPYDPKTQEPEILDFWLKGKFFKPEYHPEKGLQRIEEMKNDGRESFSIVNPPPNAYMRPHIGNVSGYAYQDVFLRYNRMLGKKVLGQPGKDHAGIQGEVVLEKIFMENKKKTKQEMGREKFYKAAYAHFTKMMPEVMSDEQRIGLSSDYDRNLFTLDPKIVKTVLGTFQKMFDDKMIYKGVRIVNWDPVAKTTLADIDTERVERDSELMYIKYPLVEKQGDLEYVTVATTRAETMLGDTAVVVNPKDKRYKDLVGKMLKLPLTDREIPIITSPHVDMEFGTGAVKLTPAHAAEDYKMMTEWNESATEGKKVSYLNIIDKEAKMTGPIPEKYKGMTTEDARKEVIKDLEALGLVVKREPHKQNIMVGERSKAVIEQIMSSQWFIDVEKLKGPAIDAVKNGDVQIHPDYMVKKYLNWMENLHDWPVSRSLWWGYRIPVWYKGDIKEETDQKTGKIIESINGQPVEGIYNAVEKGLAKVQTDDPNGENSGPIELTIIRHGQTTANNEVKFGGWSETELTNEGKKQTEETAKTLSEESYDVLISSDLIRAKQTAEIIGKELGLELIEDQRIRERNFGKLDDMTWKEFEEQYPEVAAKNEPNYQPNLEDDAETIEAVYKRIEEFLEDLKKKYAGKKVLLVTHTGVIRILRRKLLGESPEYTRENDLPNAEIIKTKLGTNEWIQDSDVLDTWFSSGQWPYATLIANDLIDTFYPTDIMETGYDILELWVSRMIMLSLYTQGKIPFKNVYLHGLVKAPDGQKMSKSKGNVIAPSEIIDQYGADALRLMYVVGNKAGAGYPISYEKLEGYKRFLNKIWNASKFIFGNAEDLDNIFISEKPDSSQEYDQKLLEELDKLVESTKNHIDNYRIGLAAEELYKSFWHYFCDVCLEDIKTRLYTKDREGNPINTSEEGKKSRKDAQETLLYALQTYMKLLHPFVPFITEKIWQEFKPGESVMYERVN